MRALSSNPIETRGGDEIGPLRGSWRSSTKRRCASGDVLFESGDPNGSPPPGSGVLRELGAVSGRGGGAVLNCTPRPRAVVLWSTHTGSTPPYCRGSVLLDHTLRRVVDFKGTKFKVPFLAVKVLSFGLFSPLPDFGLRTGCPHQHGVKVNAGMQEKEASLAKKKGKEASPATKITSCWSCFIRVRHAGARAGSWDRLNPLDR